MPDTRLLVPLLVSLLPAGTGTGSPALKPEPEPTPDAPGAHLGSDRFRAAGSVTALAFSPDESRLAAPLAANGMSPGSTRTRA